MTSNKFIVLSSALLTLVCFSACKDTNNNSQSSDSDTLVTNGTNENPISLNPASLSPEFPDATLTIKDMKSEMVGTDSVKITFNYDVKNYELKSQTSDAQQKGCANSKDGQHIHFILDNSPYAALYEPTHTFTVAKNSEHYVMSFLSRSYHESVKSSKAAILKHFSVNADGKITEMEIPNTPMLFYSRPKGDYLGEEETKNVLLDFYVFNATLGDNILLKATIDGQVFTIDKWQAYFISGAPLGELKIDLQLTDLDGNALQGVNTSVSRTSRLANQEPMQ